MKYDVEIHVAVKNLGNTPATVERTLVQFMFSDEPLPKDPPYKWADAKITNIHLVKSDEFTVHGYWKIQSSAFESLRANRLMELYVFGCAEYRDRFGQRHRVGYARQYSVRADERHFYKKPRTVGQVDEAAWESRNNLPYVTQPGYNYDIEIDEQGNPKPRGQD